MGHKFRVSKWLVGVTALIFVNFSIASESIAGQEAAGIVGRITDASGAVPARCDRHGDQPALQLPQVTTVTTDQGEYRLAPLPIGTYSLEYSLSGFQVVRREGVRLNVGFTARVDAVMRIAALEERITVIGSSPVVDTRSSSSATVLERENLELIPTGRNGIQRHASAGSRVRPSLGCGRA